MSDQKMEEGPNRGGGFRGGMRGGRGGPGRGGPPRGRGFGDGMRGRYVTFCVVFIHCVILGVSSDTLDIRLYIGPCIDL